MSRNAIILTGMIFGVAGAVFTNWPKAAGIKAVRIGMTRAEVEAALGTPERRNVRSVPKNGYDFGPMSGFNTSLLNEDRDYEEWTYRISGRALSIWFGDPRLPPLQWKVVGKASYPEDVVF